MVADISKKGYLFKYLCIQFTAHYIFIRTNTYVSGLICVFSTNCMFNTRILTRGWYGVNISVNIRTDEPLSGVKSRTYGQHRISSSTSAGISRIGEISHVRQRFSRNMRKLGILSRSRPTTLWPTSRNVCKFGVTWRHISTYRGQTDSSSDFNPLIAEIPAQSSSHTDWLSVNFVSCVQLFSRFSCRSG